MRLCYRLTFLASLTLAVPHARAQEGCNTAAQEAADQAGNGAGLAAGLAVASLALTGVMIATCTSSSGTGCPAATAALLGFSALNGVLPMLMDNTSGMGAAGAAANNSMEDCMGSLGDTDIPDIPDYAGSPASGICSTPTACGCTGAPTDSPICSKEKWGNLGKQMRDNLEKLRDPNLQLGEGADKGQMIADMEAALATFEGMEDGFGDAGLEGGEGSGGGGSKKGSGSGAAYAGGDFDLGAGFGKAGPADKTGLGAAFALNGLQLFDKDSEKELTIWQRATRRHQGSPNNKRGIFLARLENLRANASKIAKKNGGPPATAAFRQDLSGTTVETPSKKAPAPASVVPASAADRPK